LAVVQVPASTVDENEEEGTMGRASRRRRERRLAHLTGDLAGPGGATAVELPADPPPTSFLAPRPLPPTPDEPPYFAEKISKALLDVVRPLIEKADITQDQVRRFVTFGALGWNLSLLDEETRRTEALKIAREVAPEAPEDAQASLEEIARRKARLHPHDRRFIVSTEVLNEGDNWRILAIGAAAKD
jgi:hypothetical protein